MAKTYNQVSAIRGALRRVFSHSPIVRQVMNKVRREVPKFNKDGSRAKKDAVQYLCSKCLEYVKSTAISVDHIVPVIGVDDGFIDWNTFVNRLFCSEENLQVVCKGCHDAKTASERSERLTKRYTAELDAIELGGPSKENIKLLAKYINKKKTFEKVSARALALRDQFKSLH